MEVLDCPNEHVAKLKCKVVSFIMCKFVTRTNKQKNTPRVIQQCIVIDLRPVLTSDMLAAKNVCINWLLLILTNNQLIAKNFKLVNSTSP